MVIPVDSIGFQSALALLDEASVQGVSVAQAVGDVYANLQPTEDVLGRVTKGLNKNGRRIRDQKGFLGVTGDVLGLLYGSGGTHKEFAKAQRSVSKFLRKVPAETLIQILRDAGLAGQEVNPFPDASRGLRKAMLAVDAQSMATLGKLADFVKIPSITSDKKDVLKAVDWIKAELEKVGFRNIQILIPREGANPVIYAEKIKDPKFKTVWVYAHGDVQPVEDQVWETGPFHPFIRGGRLFGRGSADDKAGVMSIIAGEQALIDAGVDPQVNRAVLIETTEEAGSEDLLEALQMIKGKVQEPDVVLLTDSENIWSGVPTITSTMRGILEYFVRIQTGSGKGSHVGMFGITLDAITAFLMIFGKMLDKYGMVQIPGLTDDLPEMPEDILANLHDRAQTEEKFRLGGELYKESRLLGNPRIHPSVRAALMYQMKILGINGIPTIAGSSGRNVIDISARLQFRIPPGADLGKAGRLIPKEMKRRAQTWGRFDVTPSHLPVMHWTLDFDHPSLPMVAAALAVGYGSEEVIKNPIGATIGFLEIFNTVFPEALQVPIGVEDPFTNAHSADESLYIPDLFNATRSTIAFWYAMATNGNGTRKR